ncbi:MAG: hypothetical protein HY975_03680 [Candidatus Kerfeldbacteria bacterium]|nr:hypothetical protein [Candidatus Kerfeldbacteria bacterium]
MAMLAMAAALVAMPVKVVKQASTTVPVITISDAGAVCDPSGGLHPGLALKCFLEWLMEFTNPSDGF